MLLASIRAWSQSGDRGRPPIKVTPSKWQRRWRERRPGARMNPTASLRVVASGKPVRSAGKVIAYRRWLFFFLRPFSACDCLVVADSPTSAAANVTAAVARRKASTTSVALSAMGFTSSLWGRLTRHRFVAAGSNTHILHRAACPPRDTHGAGNLPGRRPAHELPTLTRGSPATPEHAPTKKGPPDSGPS